MTKAKMLETLLTMYADRYEAKRETRDILKFDSLSEKEEAAFKDIYTREYTQCATLESVAKELFEVDLFKLYFDKKYDL